MRTVLVLATASLLATSALAGCGDGDGSSSAEIVVTTSILGDVVLELVGDAVEVEVVMSSGVDPHQFAPSARQVAAMREADVLVVNGLGLEAELEDTIEAAADDGTDVVAVAELAPDHRTAEGAAHDDDDGHDHGDEDPHVFTDPARMAVAVAGLADALAERVEGLDGPAYRERAAAYGAELQALDAEVEQLLAPIPAERRVLVTNHDVLGYFADRYGFTVVGTVVPSLSTMAEPSARDLATLARTIQSTGVPAVFVEASSPARVAEALAAEGAAVEVVELHTESLGEAGSDAATYVGLVRSNARRIAGALSGSVAG